LSTGKVYLTGLAIAPYDLSGAHELIVNAYPNGAPYVIVSKKYFFAYVDQDRLNVFSTERLPYERSST
jgi:hypothetical protein